MSRLLLKFSLLAGFVSSFSGCLCMSGGMGCGGLTGGCNPPFSECVGDSGVGGSLATALQQGRHQRQMARRGCGCRKHGMQTYPMQMAGGVYGFDECSTCGDDGGYIDNGMGYPNQYVDDGMMSGMATEGMNYGMYPGMSSGENCPSCQNQQMMQSYPAPQEMNYHQMPNAPMPPMAPMEPTPAPAAAPRDPAANGEYFAPPITSPKTSMMMPGMQRMMSYGGMQQGMPAPVMMQQGMVSGGMMAPQMMQPQVMQPQVMHTQMMPQQQMMQQMPIQQTQHYSDTPPAIQAF